MKRITQEELNEFLRKHKLWLADDPEGERANLYGANLSGADLRSADLYGADLYGADLRSANLSGANLSGADLRSANLSGADLRSANLRSANLYGADLYGANLYGANLYGANLSGANLRSADLDLPIACPERGSFIAFKKASRRIVVLKITEDAQRCSATSRKCRCSKAEVIAIENYDGTPSELTSVPSDYNSSFIYEIGKTVEVKNFNTDRWNECSAGIHFFITRQEAVNY